MNHEINFKNANFSINGKEIPEELGQYAQGMDNEEAYMIATVYINAGDTITYKCENNTKITFEIREKDELQMLIDSKNS